MTLFPDIPETVAPPLELARRRLDALVAKRDKGIADARESMVLDDYMASQDFELLCRRIRDAEREVARLEEAAL